MKFVWISLFSLSLALSLAHYYRSKGKSGFGSNVEDNTEVVDHVKVDSNPKLLRVIRGRLFLEQIVDDVSTLRGPDKQNANRTDEEPVTLFSPEPASCRIQAWQDGLAISPIVPCRPEGMFQLEVQTRGGDSVAIEMQVAGRLRGLLDIVIDDQLELTLPTVALGLGYPLQGTVVDSSSTAIVGAQIEARPKPDWGESEPWRAKTDQKGRFRIDTLPVGPISVRVLHSDFAESGAEVIAPDSNVMITMSGLVDLQGEVLADGDFSQRARVRLEGSSIWPAIETSLDSKGGFRFERLSEGLYGVEVIIPAATPGQPEFASVPLENVSPDHRLSLALVPAFRLPVKVIGIGAKPLANARVRLSYATVGMLHKIALTNEEGRCLIGPVVEGPYVLRVESDGYLPHQPVEIDMGPKVGERVLRLAKSGSIRGLVQDEQGAAVANAEIVIASDQLFTPGEQELRADLFKQAWQANGRISVTSTRVADIPLFRSGDGPIVNESPEGNLMAVLSDESGNFSIEGLVPGQYRLNAEHLNYLASKSLEIKIESGKTVSGVVLRVKRGRQLSGRVVNTNQGPVAFAQIEFSDGKTHLSDRRGWFTLGNRQGRQPLVVRARGMEVQHLVVDLRHENVEVEITMHEAMGRVEGRISDGNYQPIENAEILLRYPDEWRETFRNHSDERGLFNLDQLDSGRAELTVTHSGFAPHSVLLRSVSKSTPFLEIQLQSDWNTELWIRSTGDSAPISRARIRSKDMQWTSDRNGYVRLSQLVEEEVEVTIDAKGWTPETIRLRRRLQSEENQKTRTVELERGGAMRGSIANDLGELMEAVQIQVVDSRAKTHRVVSDSNGEWQFDNLAVGDVIIEVAPPSGMQELLAPIRHREDILGDETTRDVQLRFDRK